jgi:hypothetical protein
VIILLATAANAKSQKHESDIPMPEDIPPPGEDLVPLPAEKPTVVFSSTIKDAIQSCLQSAIDKQNFVKTRDTKGIFINLECHGQVAQVFYTLLGRFGIPELPIAFEDHSHGVGHQFGNSNCYVTQQTPDGTPTADFFCRLAVDIGGTVLDRF